MSICDQIKELILQQIPEAKVIVSDPQNDATHLEAVVAAKEFEELSLIAQHKMVMNILKEAFNSHLHALKLKTCTLKQWQERFGETL